MEKNMHKIESVKTVEKILESFSVLVKVWTVGAASVVHQCTNHETTRDMSISA